MVQGQFTVLVQQLEEHLSVKLLNRTTRRLTLTDDGAAYLEGVQRVLADIDELDGALAKRRTQPRGRLRVDVPAAAGRHVIAPALPEFFQLYPEVQLELGSSDRPVDLIAEGVDCVIRGGAVHDSSLVSRPLGMFRTITCAAPAYLKAHGKPTTPDEIAEHQTVDFFSAKTGRVFPFDFASEDGTTIEVRGRTRVAVNDADTQIATVVAGLGLAQLPLTRRLQQLLQAGDLVTVLDKHRAADLPLQVLYPRNRHLSGRVRAFVDWTVALYARKFEALRSND